MVTLFRNGNIHTMDGALPQADTFIVNENKFVYVGNEAGAAEYLRKNGPADREADLSSHLVLPGFNDSHMHFLHYAKGLFSVNLSGTKSIGELKSRMKEGLLQRSGNDEAWLEGEGWNQDYFQDEKRFPDKFDLDEVSKDVPILIARTCFHIGVLNTAAMKAIGLNRETAAQYGDQAGLLPDGEPDGIIKENLLGDVKARISRLNMEVMKDLLAKAQYKALAQGLTSVQSDDIGYMPDYDYDMMFKAFKELETEGKLNIRVGEQCLLEKAPAIRAFFDKGYHYGWGTDKCRVTCIKMLADGSLGARTAAMREPYADEPGTKGLELFTKDQLDEMVMVSHSHNCPVAIHAIGNRAMDLALNAIEKARKTDPAHAPRHGIVHCQITDEALLERFRKLEVLALIQPIFIDYDMNIVADRVGPEIAGTSYLWKTMIKKGIHASFGTDCPVEPFNTMPNIYSAVTRKNLTGEEKREFLPDEKMTMQEAVHAYTVEGAYASGEEEIKGSIAVGKLADFIVLDRDLFKLSGDEEILETKVLETYLDGKLVYNV